MFEANEIDIAKNYPDYFAWHSRLLERPAVQRMIADKDTAMDDFMAKMAANGPPKPQQLLVNETTEYPITVTPNDSVHK